MKIFQKRNNAVPYSSTRTRSFSADTYLGGAELKEENENPAMLDFERREDLEFRFNSGCNRTDIPRMWGHPAVDRKLGKVSMSLASEIASWRRNGGEPLWKK